MKLLSAIVFLVLLIAADQVPIIADAKECSISLPDASRPCEQPDCIDTCVRIYGQRASALCIPRACQCFYPC
ncbi:hypothetical protein AMTRI_Chr01g102850 [Amborella trichopoda]